MSAHLLHTGLVADARVKKHYTGPHHPEQAARFSAAMSRLEWSGIVHDLTRLSARFATDDELALVHTRPYLALVDKEVAEKSHHLSTGDTDICPESSEVARLAAGCVLSGVDAVFAREVQNAFCVVRPPGHHASAAIGMG